MKKTTWMGVCGSLAACLAFTMGGCGSGAGAGADEMRADEMKGDEVKGDETGEGAALGAAQQAFSASTLNACTACAGVAPDGVCASSENAFNCAQDCACGDGTCAGGETPQSCPIDCKLGSNPSSATDDFCGNGRCEPWEKGVGGVLCAKDCKLAPDSVGTLCGDQSCDPGETSATCPADCGNKATCGNGTCEPLAGEDHTTCDIDCTSTFLPPGRFLGTHCVVYALYAKYSDGSGGVTEHLVTPLAAGCTDAYPWKVVTNAGTCNGSTLLRPDGTLCTIQNANCVNAVTFTPGSPVLMAQDPNNCGMYTTGAAGFQPLEWSKVDIVTCSPSSPCTVYTCTGSANVKPSGQAVRWRPQIAFWSIYAPFCQ